MLREEQYRNEQENNTDNEAQKLFEEGMPESVNAGAIPSSLDESIESENTVNESFDSELNVAPTADENESGEELNSSESDFPDAREQRDIVIGDTKISSQAHSHIKGWGVDADPSNDPTYPIKNRTNEEQLGKTWNRPTMQEQDVELLMSNEHNSRPAVFSNEEPPKGLSGVLKRKAFKYSESDYRHWLGLMLSDKIGVLEGKIDDLKHGHIPNFVAERGLKSEWKYNRKEFVKKTAVKVAVVGAAVGLLLLSRRKKKDPGMVENLIKAL